MKLKLKITKNFVSLLLILMTMLSLTACTIFHKHVWQDHLVKAPNCTEVGILKTLCIECGKTKYSEISMSEHNYINGICTNCGSIGSPKKQLTATAMPENADNQGMWSFYNVHNKACSTMNSTMSYSAFMASLSGTSLKNATVDAFGLLHITVTYPLTNGNLFELPVVLNIDKVSPANPTSPIGVLMRADIENNELFLTYTTGTQVSAGKILASIGTTISGFGINAKKELIIYYSNNTIAYAGIFAS